jgi:hypothetical protein
MHVKRNTGARSCNHCCCGKPISITYSECLFLAFGIQHAMRMRHIAMWPVRLCSIFPHHYKIGMIFWGKISEYKLCFDFLYNVCLKYFSF